MTRFSNSAAGWLMTIVAAMLLRLSFEPMSVKFVAWLAPGLFVWSIAGLSVERVIARAALFAVVASIGLSADDPGSASLLTGLDPAVATAAVVQVLLVAVPLVWAGRVVSGRSTPVIAAWLWVGAELAQSALFGATGWVPLGYTQLSGSGLREVIELGGSYAVSFAMVLISVGLIEIVSEGLEHGRVGPRRSGLGIGASR